MPPPYKRQKTSAVAEIVFDTAAREDYLTGFHKRKQARIKHAQEVNAKKEREEKIEDRRRMRQERKDDLERHVKEVNDLLKKARGEEDEEEVSSAEGGSEGENEEWNGIEDTAALNHEEEYIDEDKYTTVTVEAVDITRDGMVDLDNEDEDDVKKQKESKLEAPKEDEETSENAKRKWTKKRPARDTPKQKKKKFRYESKAERKVTRHKERSKNSSLAKARRG